MGAFCGLVVIRRATCGYLAARERRALDTEESPVRNVSKSMMEPPAPQPKQWKRFCAEYMCKDGLRSAWKGQQALKSVGPERTRAEGPRRSEKARERGIWCLIWSNTEGFEALAHGSVRVLGRRG